MLGYALTSNGIDNVIFRAAEVLLVPVLILALVALAVVIFELGTFIVEVRGRAGRRGDLESAVDSARGALLAGDVAGASRAAAGVARSSAMAAALSVIVSSARAPTGEHRIRKALADFDFAAQRRLNRTRLLVRAGPALGLMGTLIPLSPALSGLAQGNVARLTANLRIAFSVTVLGLLVGAAAFGLSLYRDRMYGQDLSDLEYFAAVVSDPREIPEAGAAVAGGDKRHRPRTPPPAEITNPPANPGGQGR
jgi:biopolymer transport protein ExbB/TolQ